MILVVVEGAIPADMWSLPYGVTSSAVVAGHSHWATGESQSAGRFVSVAWTRAAATRHLCGAGQSARPALAIEPQAQQRHKGSASVQRWEP